MPSKVRFSPLPNISTPKFVFLQILAYFCALNLLFMQQQLLSIAEIEAHPQGSTAWHGIYKLYWQKKVLFCFKQKYFKK